MSAPAPLLRLLSQARMRRFASVLLLAAPPWLALLWLLRLSMTGLLVGGLLLLIVAVGWLWARRLELPWLVRQLDQRLPALEDSSGLLLGLEPPRSALAHAQIERLKLRLGEIALPDLRPAWPWRGALLSLLLGVLFIAASELSHSPIPAAAPDVSSTTVSVRESSPQIEEARLRITPPAYTGLEASLQHELEAQFPAGSTVHWSLRLNVPAGSVTLVFHDEQRLALVADDQGRWLGQRELAADSYYRVEIDDGLQLAGPASQAEGPWRLGVIADQPPQLRVIEPTRTLIRAEIDQRSWSLRFEASDDYGLGEAELQLTQAKGTGEQITVSERRLRLTGVGDARQRTYTRTLDLAELGFEEGDDLIARLRVSDRAQPTPQHSETASYILRWPARRGADASGVELSVERAMPAYFRSQRQLIIDTEALIAARLRPAAGQAAPDPAEFAGRSDALGVDQRILRLRYGQFLGEEAEGAPSAEMRARAAALVAEDERDHEGHDHGHEHDHDHDEKPGFGLWQRLWGGRGEGDAHDEHPDKADHDSQDRDEADLARHAPDDHSGHDHGPSTPFGSEGEGFGSAIAILEEFGHMHDTPEAATLFDPTTRRLLRAALNEMWSSELELRQARPQQSLPHQYRALDYIKQVQQSTRIYLSRVGLELPPIDFGRRLQAEAKDLARPRDPLQPRESEAPAPVQLWHALAAEQEPPPDWLPALRDWLADAGSELDDPLALLEAAQGWSLDPGCADCRQRLQVLLWPLQPLPIAAPSLRAPADAVGERYLQRLDGAASVEPEPAR